MPLILIVDDIEALADQYAYDLRRLGAFETTTASGGRAALETLAAEPVDCVLLDLEMPGMDGMEVLREMQRLPAAPPVIVYTGTGNFDRCTQAIRLGAFGFIDKSESMQRVVREVQQALEHASVNREVAALRRKISGDGGLIGSSPPMAALKAQLKRLASIPSPVLILGESGSGKELVARELHRQGDGAGAGSRPFVAINAGALPENLVESELFGHEKGAFTGAERLHRGAFERADGGTLFLDEIGELAPAVQAKLLRVLETKQLQRVGGERLVPVTARVVAATHRDLDGEAQAGRFRTDLLFRLNTHVLRVPPLRERSSDIPELVEALLLSICDNYGIPVRRLSPQVLQFLTGQRFERNNVRELRNTLERLVIATDDTEIGASALPDGTSGPGPDKPTGTSFAEQKAEAERAIVVRALHDHDWRITDAARQLGLADHASLLKIMRRLQIARPDGR